MMGAPLMHQRGVSRTRFASGAPRCGGRRGKPRGCLPLVCNYRYCLDGLERPFGKHTDVHMYIYIYIHIYIYMCHVCSVPSVDPLPNYYQYAKHTRRLGPWHASTGHPRLHTQTQRQNVQDRTKTNCTGRLTAPVISLLVYVFAQVIFSVTRCLYRHHSCPR